MCGSAEQPGHFLHVSERGGRGLMTQRCPRPVRPAKLPSRPVGVPRFVTPGRHGNLLAGFGRGYLQPWTIETVLQRGPRLIDASHPYRHPVLCAVV